MKASKKKIIIPATIALIILCTLWRFWPHSFSDIISVDTASVTGLSCIGSVSGLSEGKPFTDIYMLQAVGSDEEDFQKMMEILDDTKYRQDFRNILPWPITTLRASGNYNGYSADLMLAWGESHSESCNIVMLSHNMIAVDVGSNVGYKLYHPYDNSVLDKLVDYVKLNGTMN